MYRSIRQEEMGHLSGSRQRLRCSVFPLARQALNHMDGMLKSCGRRRWSAVPQSSDQTKGQWASLLHWTEDVERAGYSSCPNFPWYKRLLDLGEGFGRYSRCY